MKNTYFILLVIMLTVAGCESQDKSSEDSSFYMVRGEKQLGEGKYDQAVTSFEKAVKLDPNLKAGYEKLALIYGDLYGNVEKARYYYDRCIELEKNPVMKKQLKQWLDELDQPDKIEWQQARLAPEEKPADRQQAQINLETSQDEELMKSMEALKSNLKLKEQKLDEKNKANTELSQETSQLKQELQKLQQQMKSIEEKGTVPVEKYENLESAIEAKRKQIASLETDKKTLESQNATFKAGLLKAQKDNKELEENYQKLKTAYQKLWAKANEVLEQYKTREQKYIQALKKKEEELARLEKTEQSPASPTKTKPAGRFTTYIVQEGDTLRKIAENKYGDPDKSDLIYNANRDRIENPNVIKAGTILKVPLL